MGAVSQHFQALIRALSPELYRYALALSQHPEQAQDLVQETFLCAWRSQSRLRSAGAARAWLYTILRHEHARLHERRRPEARDPHALPDIPSYGYATSVEAFVLRRALHGLEPDYREPLLLQVIGGFSCREIGELLGLNTNTVLTRLFRARKALRTALQPEVAQSASGGQ
jgi:RNA polymerase sigma-70 factor (ECF subfamily)